ncbi:MAG: DUF1801 domain-containing protein [Hyphomonadaceae bacterium]
MAEPKTRPTKASVSAFIAAVENDTRRADAKAIDKMMRDITGEKPVMWGSSIVGYGSYESRSGDWPIVGFAPRKSALVLYLMGAFKGRDALMKKLGKHKAGKGCVYITKLADVDQDVLRDLIAHGVTYMRTEYEPS